MLLGSQSTQWNFPEKPIRKSVAFSGSSLTFGPDKLAAQCDWLWHYLTSGARGEEKHCGDSAKLNLSNETELLYSWNWTLLEDGVGSSSKLAQCWLAGAAPALQTSGVCVCMCVRREGVPGSHISGAKGTTAQTNSVFGMSLSFLPLSEALCRVIPFLCEREREAKNSRRWPGNVAIEFIFVEKEVEQGHPVAASHFCWHL